MLAAFPVRQVVVPILGAEALFPVRRIYCVGQNYEDHAKEMGGKTSRALPFFFSKPTDSIVTAAADSNLQSNQVKVSAHYPPKTENYQLEVELVVAIGPSSKHTSGVYSNLAPSDASSIIYGYAVGLDMTRRDLQLVAKQGGKPWEFGKGADDSTPLSCIVPVANIPASMAQPAEDGVIRNGSIASYVNGEQRQSSNLSNVVTPIDELLSILSNYVALQPGDLVFTGTPAGVSPVNIGDTVRAVVENVGELEVKFVQ